MANVSGWSQDDLLFPDYGPGTCINCGFLCQRSLRTHDLLCSEIIMDDRARGTFGPALGVTLCTIWCFARGAHLPQELVDSGEDEPIEERLLTIIQKGRDCPRFYPYREGFSPPEHAAEQRMATLEQDRRNFEEKVEHQRRLFELGMERERRRFEIALFVVLTFIGVAVAIVGLVHGW